MSQTVIQAENLGKKYLISHHNQQRERYTALRDVLARQARGLFSGVRSLWRGEQLLGGDTVEEFWALQDLNFSIQQGDRVGIIGRNGAGKSTLLKILSRITEPSTGRVSLRGRVASLLEVGTGFHPELTGRENIFLNGAILGMTRHEIKQKFDEIVDFAGVERFLDTPVKRYSSGMYVRLAFAVAAHLEPEILVVDEVLAVGDAEFQKKCLGKMEEVSKNQGRTVLFVSHQLTSIQNLCNQGILLVEGKIKAKGEINHVVDLYTQSTLAYTKQTLEGRTDRKGNGLIKITSIHLNSENNVISNDKALELFLSYTASKDRFYGQFLISINTYDNTCVLFLDSKTIKNFPSTFPEQGNIHISLSNDFNIGPGKYYINVAAFFEGELADHVQNAAIIEVVSGDFYGAGKAPAGKTLCLVKQQWQFS